MGSSGGKRRLPQWAIDSGGLCGLGRQGLELGTGIGVSMQTLEYVTLEREHDQIVELTLNRPDRRNALSLAMMKELDGALRAVGEDRSARVVVLRGEGPAFSAGHDLSELIERDVEMYRTIFDACVDLMQTIASIPQPVIAEVARVATAAGCQLVAACDLAVAATTARLRRRACGSDSFAVRRWSRWRERSAASARWRCC